MSEVTANYMGFDKASQKYLVNVRTAHPTGKIGDAGYIKRFDEEKEAKNYTKIVNDTKQDVFVHQKPQKMDNPIVRHEGDTFTQSFKGNEDKKVKVEPCEKISLWRGMFSRLTDEQIKSVNDTGRLPEGTKFQGHVICHNWFGIMPGTRTLPAGYELKKDSLGFTVCVLKDTEGRFIKDVK